MAVIAPQTPADNKRLDDLSKKVDDGFHRVDQSFQRVDEGFREHREEMRELRSEMNLRFDAVQRTTLQIGAGLFGTMFVGFLGVIATLLAVHS